MPRAPRRSGARRPSPSGWSPAAPRRPDAAPTEPGLAAEAETRTALASPPPRGRRTRRRARAGRALAALAAAAVAGPALRDEPTTGAATQPTPTPTRDRPPPRRPRDATATATAACRASPTTIDDVGDRPSGIALAGGDLWVRARRQPRLTRIDARDGRERSEHPKVGDDASAIVAYRDERVGRARDDRRWCASTRATGKERRSASRSPAAARRLAVDRHGVWVGDPLRHRRARPAAALRPRGPGACCDRCTVAEGVGGRLAAAGALWVVRRDTGKLARLGPATRPRPTSRSLPAAGAVDALRRRRDLSWSTIDGDGLAERIDADGRGRSPAPPATARRRRSSPAAACTSPAATTRPCSCSTRRHARAVGTPIDVGLNPVAMVADGRSIWVTVLGDNAVTRIDYR